MTETYTDHSVPTHLAGSVLHTGIAISGASSAATPPSVPLRRILLAGGAAAFVVAAWSAAVVSAPLPTPDAGLISLCARLDRLQCQVDALFPADWYGMTDAGLEAADAAARLLEAEQRSFLDHLDALTPVTVAGCAALACSMILLRPDLLRAGPEDDPDMRLLAVLLRGLAGQA